MYVVDITRCNEDEENDLLVGNDSMDAKSKTINYILDYVFANYNVNINKNILDQNLNMDLFSLKDFMYDNYSIKLNDDLIIQAFPTDKEHCLFVKHYDKDIDTYPIIYGVDKNKKELANTIMSFLVNDSLIHKYQDDLSIYDKLKLDKNHNGKFIHENIRSETISLYKGGLFLEELLNNAVSYNQVKKDLDINI